MERLRKERIIEEIQRTAAENGGVALGEARFQAETGISVWAWRGKFWRKWSEAIKEAGFAANRLFGTETFDRATLSVRLLELTRRLGKFPTDADLLIERQTDKTSPMPKAFRRLGNFAARIELLRVYATEHPEYQDVLNVLPRAGAEAADLSDNGGLGDGSVYMLKLGKHYKIGKTFSVPRRHQEIAIELPEKPDIIHVITTDDPSGIETYWHKRFALKRTNGEWFALTRDDIRAFRRRRFM